MKLANNLSNTIRFSFGFICIYSAINLSTASEVEKIALNIYQDSVKSAVVQTKTVNNFAAPIAHVDEVCKRIAKKLGSVRLSDCKGRGMEPTGGYSVGNLPIIVKEYGPVGTRAPQAKVLLIGGIHGDEYSSVSLVFKWMKILDRHHSGLFHWKMVPVMNPDGLLQKKSQRMNKNGVDLNRNFPTPNWEAESHKYWIKTSRNPRRYPGSAPLSEPESQWLANYIAEFKPDVIVSVHAPFGILDFDGPRAAPKKFGPLQLNLLGTYPGSLGNYAGINKQIPVVTIELPYAGIMPKKHEINSIWMDLVKWLKRNSSEITRQAKQDQNRIKSQPVMLEMKVSSDEG